MCDKIIEAKGTIVLDENLRTGRRARKMHGEGDRKTKPRKRDRKSTHLLELPVHPVLKGAYAILMGLEGGGGCWCLVFCRVLAFFKKIRQVHFSGL